MKWYRQCHVLGRAGNAIDSHSSSVGPGEGVPCRLVVMHLLVVVLGNVVALVCCGSRVSSAAVLHLVVLQLPVVQLGFVLWRRMAFVGRSVVMSLVHVLRLRWGVVIGF